MTAENRIKIPSHINWRRLLSEFVIIVFGVLVALWVDQLREARFNSQLEVEYVKSLLTDLEADLAQFDNTEEWMRKSEANAAIVLALYEGSPPTDDLVKLVTAVETAGWQYSPSITRNTLDDLRSTGNFRLITDPALRRAIANYYASLENIMIPYADMRDRIWDLYDARVANVLRPDVRLGVLQSDESFGLGITSDAIEAAPAPNVEKLIAALRAFPELEIAAGEVLYQTINQRAGVGMMRKGALKLKAILEQWLASGD